MALMIGSLALRSALALAFNDPDVAHGKFFGFAQDLDDLGITAPERIVEPYNRYGYGIAQWRQSLGQLPQVDRTGEILRSPIIDETSFATDVLDSS
jgi:hypothetical protein